MLIDFLEFNKPVMNDDGTNEYKLNVANATYNICKNELSLICKLTDRRTGNTFLVKETMLVGSKKYRKVMRELYAGDDGDIIAVDTAELCNYVGTTKLKTKGDKTKIDWETITPTQSLLSELWRYYHPEINY